MSFLEKFFSNIRSARTQVPGLIHINPAQTDRNGDGNTVMVAGEHYFTVRVNELFLSKKREWFQEFDPMVYVLTEFDYNKQPIRHPFIVGRSMMEADFPNLPKNLLLRNKVVAGIHPYKGDNFTISIVLSKVKIDDYLQRALQVIEDVSGLFSSHITKLLSGYKDAAKLVIDSLDKLFSYEATKEGITPIVGMSQTFMDGQLKPGYILLLDAPEQEFQAANFFVEEDKLLYQDGSDKQPFRQCSYVLLSIDALTTRPFDKLEPDIQYQDLLKYIAQYPTLADDSDERKTAQGMMNRLKLALMISPDLTEPHKKQLMDYYYAEVKTLMSDKHKLAAAGKKIAVADNYWSGIQSKIMKL